MRTKAPNAGTIVVLIGLAIVGATTLGPAPYLADLAARTPIWCLVCGDLGGVDVILNLLLFVPLGLGLRLRGWSTRQAVLAGLGTTLAVETLQYWAIAGRDASLSDLLTNTGGTWLGAALGGRIRSLAQPAPATARRLVWGCLGIWLVVTQGTALAMRPAFPANTLYIQWAPAFRHLSIFAGVIETVTIGGSAYPTGPAQDQQALREALDTTPVAISALVHSVPQPYPPRLAPIASVASERRATLVRLAQRGTDAVFTVHTVGSTLQLRDLSLSLPGVFAGTGADSTELLGEVWSDSVRLQQRNGQEETTVRLSISPHWTWVLIYPWDLLLGPSTPSLTGLWLMVIFAPIGYWSAFLGWARLRRLAPAALGIIAGMVVIPLLNGYGVPHPAEWAGLVAGVFLGLLTGSMLKRNSVA